MTRTLAGSLLVGALTLLLPATSRAQTHIDVGVWTPNGGGRVVIGGPRVYRGPVYVPRRPVYVPVAPVYAAPRPVYVVPGYRYGYGYRPGWERHGRAYRSYYDDRYDGRGYRRDIARAEAEYDRDVRRAQRDYYDDVRDAGRDYRR